MVRQVTTVPAIRWRRLARDGRSIYVTGTRLPLAGTDGAVFVADVERNKIWVWVMIGDRLFEYRERPAQPDLPAEVGLFLERWRGLSAAPRP